MIPKNENNMLKLEKESLQNNINIQKETHKEILDYMKNLSESINNLDESSTNSVLDLLTDLKHCSELCTENISVLEKCVNKIDKINEKNDDFSIPKVENPPFIQEFDFIIPRKIEHIENTLVVSDSQKTVTLPYKIDELNKTLEQESNKYSCIDDIIFESYTLPLEMFKNPFTSRYKEAFKLIRKREHGSILDAIELGLELMFNYNLHPAIIAACKNLEELDIYLDYLSEGKTNEFKCFNVKFDLPPAVIK